VQVCSFFPWFCHQGSWQSRGDRKGKCVRAGENESPRRLSSAVSPVYSTRANMHFDTTRSLRRSFVHSTIMSPLYRVPAAFAPRYREPVRRSDRLPSHVEMCGHENSNSKEEREQECHTAHTPAYILSPTLFWSALVRQRKGRFPGQMPNTIS